MKNIKSEVEINEDFAALELVFQESDLKQKNKLNRYYIKNNKENNMVVVWDRKENKMVHDFGTYDYYAGLMTVYAQIPCNFDLK